MKKSALKKALITAELLLLLSLPALSQEFSASVTDLSKVYADQNQFTSPYFEQSETFTASLYFQAGQKTYLAAEGYITHELNADLSFSPENIFTANLSLLKFSTTFRNNEGTSSNLVLGRFNASDSTGLIFSQCADGIMYQSRKDILSYSISLFYTGLINADENAMLSSDGNISPSEQICPVYSLASPYIIAAETFCLPYIVLNQSAGIETMAAIPVPGITGPSQDNNSRLYATLFMNGPLAPFIFYNISTTACTVNFKSLSDLSRISIKIYPDFFDSCISLEGIYASGNNFNILSPFTAITKTAATGAASEPSYSSIIKAAAGVSFKPVNDLYVSIDGDGVFKFDSDIPEFTGIDAGLSLIYQPFTDLQLSLSANTYQSLNSADQTESKTSVTAGAVLSF